MNFASIELPQIEIYLEMADKIRTKIARDAKYYLQKLNRSLIFLFGQQANRLALRVPLYVLIISPRSIQ